MLCAELLTASKSIMLIFSSYVARTEVLDVHCVNEYAFILLFYPCYICGKREILSAPWVVAHVLKYRTRLEDFSTLVFSTLALSSRAPIDNYEFVVWTFRCFLHNRLSIIVNGGEISLSGCINWRCSCNNSISINICWSLLDLGMLIESTWGSSRLGSLVPYKSWLDFSASYSIMCAMLQVALAWCLHSFCTLSCMWWLFVLWDSLFQLYRSYSWIAPAFGCEQTLQVVSSCYLTSRKFWPPEFDRSTFEPRILSLSRILCTRRVQSCYGVPLAQF